MEEKRRSPVLIPFAMVHIGAFGIISFYLAVILKYNLISWISAAALLIDIFLIIAGLIAIGRFRQRQEHQDTAATAHNALSIFFFPFLTVICLPLYIFMCVSRMIFFIPVIIIAMQISLNKYSTLAAKNYCLLLNCNESYAMKVLFYLVITLFNWSPLVLCYHLLGVH